MLYGDIFLATTLIGMYLNITFSSISNLVSKDWKFTCVSKSALPQTWDDFWKTTGICGVNNAGRATHPIRRDLSF